MKTDNSAQQDERVMLHDLHFQSKKNYPKIKRFCDFFIVLILLVLTVPLFLLIALCIKAEDPKSHVIYSQMRCGRGGKVFRMYKFRTMVPNADQILESLRAQNEMEGPVFKIHNDPRVTKVGRVLRASNLDELPQLWNILMGDMALVGPRPALLNEVAMYNEYQMQRLYVRPGLTCYWQISDDRNSITFDQWVEMDIQYVLDRSMLVDLKILFRTALCVFKRTGC